MSRARKLRNSGRSAHFVDPLTIGFDRLQILIEAFAKRLEDRLFWLTPGAVAVTVGLTLLVSDFKDMLFLKAQDWRDGAIILLVLSLGWTLVAGIRAFRAPSIEEVMDGIAQESLAPLRNYALAFFRARDRHGVSRVLVYFDRVWTCFLCPFVSLQPDQSGSEDVSEPAADRFGLPKQALVAHEMTGLEVRSHKRSEASHKFNHYRFAFYFMEVLPMYEDRFSKSEFEIQGRRYQWMTIEELLADPTSAARNSDVFAYIRDHRQSFLNDTLALSLKRPIQ